MREYTQVEKETAAVLAREDLYFFSRWMFMQRKGFQWLKSKHHQIICDALMKVYSGEITRLIINIAPRYSKTELAVINFMAWALGKSPDSEFIHTSYSSVLAANNAWQTRELVQHEAYQEIFPSVQLRTDSAAKSEWRTTAGGIVYATGAGGTITGYGAGKHREGFGGCIILDDPHKADEARSDVMRSNVIDWFQNTLESRKNSPHTPIILIMQRLHESDLAGWLIDKGNGEDWHHIKLETLREDGTALWPAKHDEATLRRMRDANPYVFSGQYQQSPSAPQGNVIKPDAMPIIAAIPIALNIQWVRKWDLAASIPKVGHDPDWTVGAKFGKDKEGRFYISDIVRMRGLADEVESAIVNTAARDGKNVRIAISQDPGQAGKAQVLYLTRKLTGYHVTASPETGDKVTRAEPMASQINVGNISLIKADWNDALISEMRMFPNGKHDDQVDACSGGFNELIRPPEPAKNVGIIHMNR